MSEALPTGVEDVAQWANVVIALCALVVAIVAIFLTWKTLRNQIRHNKLSVRPIPFIALSKRDGMAVALENHGFGPFRIDLFEIVRSGAVLQNIVEILPENPPPGVEVEFTTGMFQRTFPANEKINIFRVTINTPSSLALSYLNQVKLNIGDTIIKVGYSDIYDDKFDIHQKELSWLCRD